MRVCVHVHIVSCIVHFTARRTFASMTGKSTQLNSFGSFMLIVMEFVGISLGSVVVGSLIGLIASAVRGCLSCAPLTCRC